MTKAAAGTDLRNRDSRPTSPPARPIPCDPAAVDAQRESVPTMPAASRRAVSPAIPSRATPHGQMRRAAYCRCNADGPTVALVAVFHAARSNDDVSESWVRFEGPGKLHVRRWHRVTQSTTGRLVTVCGRYVWDDQVLPSRGEGIECATCARLIAARESRQH